MLLAADPSFELFRFMQILVWIILPVMLSAIAFTVYFHYRKKKKLNPMGDEEETRFVLAAPELFNHKKSDGDYVFFDHSGLIREYKKRMFYNHARYAALRSDYASLQAKYSSLSITDLKNNKKIYMKNHNDSPSLAKVIGMPTEEAETDKKELMDKLEQMNRSYQRLEEENRFLQEQLTLPTASDDERNRIIDRWTEENKALREKTAELDYQSELLEEKKAQIIFLQNQLEQRIKSQHQAEQQKLQAVADKDALVQQVESLNNELLLKQEQVDRLEASLCEKEEQFNERQQVLASRLDQVTYLENVLRETKEQNELLHAELGDTKDQIALLQQQLEDERSTLSFVERKLQANRQMMQRLHKELLACVEE